ncbi:cupredoxin domain-containing protein [Candidatus Saccharibacteria bacterium]|nr:cupredoxin domain-containing protein [Candidatus Saccharibacteria bacterium]
MMKYLAGLVVVVLVAAAVFIIAGRGDDQNTTNSSKQTESTAQSTNNTAANNQAAATTDKVSISNFTFSPTDITVKKGTKVTWTNNDSVAHTVEFDTDDIQKSETLGGGGTFNFTFNDEGAFNYICGIHPSMHGTVTVTE